MQLIVDTFDYVCAEWIEFLNSKLCESDGRR